MLRIRATIAVACALALRVAEPSAQPTPKPRVLATFTGDSINEFSVAPNGKFILLATKSKIYMYEVATRQSWPLADAGERSHGLGREIASRGPRRRPRG